jgi:hypothetical protein
VVAQDVDVRPKSVVVSADGKRTAYVRSSGPGKAYVVVGGSSGPACAVVLAAKFSPDGRHFAYVARRPRAQLEAGDNTIYPADRWFVSLDGKEVNGVGPHVNSLSFDADGTLHLLTSDVPTGPSSAYMNVRRLDITPVNH